MASQTKYLTLKLLISINISMGPTSKILNGMVATLESFDKYYKSITSKRSFISQLTQLR